LTSHASRSPTLAGFLRTCLWLGIAGFGGGFGVVRLLKTAAVDQKGWIDEPGFVDALAVANTLPGPVATNLLTLLAYRLRGWVGAVAATITFLAPSAALMVAFAAGYDRFNKVPALTTFMDGMGAATVGVIVAVAVDMGRVALAHKIDWVLAAAAAALIATRTLALFEVVALAALLGVAAPRLHDGPPRSSRLASIVLPVPAVILGAPLLLSLLFVFARIGIATFGGGFAMIPAIDDEVVRAHGWLDEAAFRHAIVLGQITPGPIAISATFIGFRVARWAGAAVATAGMFGPPLIVSLIAARSLEAFRSNRTLRAALHAIGSAMVGIIVAAAVALFKSAVHTASGLGLAAAAAVGLIASRRLSPVAVVAAGGAAAWILMRAGLAP
jgi:chromate transporter